MQLGRESPANNIVSLRFTELLLNCESNPRFNPNRTGLFLTCLAPPPPPLLSSLFVYLSQRNFVQRLTIEALAQLWKKFTKNNDVIDNDVIIVKNLAEKTVKSVNFKIDAACSFIFNPTETLQKH